MNSPVLILYLEDSPRDAELVQDKLQAGMACELRIARDRAEYEAALAQTRFDLILSDYCLPDYDGMAALALAREKQPDVPFILISGTLGEEQAVDCVLRGATDFVLKQHLIRLIPAVLRALTAAEEQRKRTQAEEFLHASEVRYRRLFETAKDGILILDAATGMVVDVNPFLIELLGLSHESFLGKEIWKLGFFKDIVANVAKFAELQSKSYVRYEDLPLETVDGRKIEVEFVSNVYLVNRQRVIQCNIRDITERKRTEVKLADELTRWRSLFEQSRDGIVILDQDGKVYEANRCFAEMLGYSFDELRLRHVWDWDTQWTRDQLLGMLRSVDAAGQFVETRHRRKDGYLYDVEIRSNAVVIGGQKLIFAICRDVTERKQAEVAVRDAQALSSTIIDSIPGSFYLLDENGRYARWNTYQREVIIGKPEAQIAGMNAFDTIHPKDRALVQARIANVLQDGKEEVVEGRMLLRGGPAFIWMLLTGRRIMIEGRPFLVGTGIDITTRKQAESQDQLTHAVLELLNHSGKADDTIRSILDLIKQSTGFDAVGIRLRQGDDYPYFVQQGFTDDFLLKENTLVAHDEQGGVCKNKNGTLCLECTCGLTISGHIDPANPFFTPGGSFWTNNSVPLLDLPPNQDPRLHPRNRCIHAGFLSVALIPIRAGKEIIGLLQLNSHRPNQFTLESIQFFEGLNNSIGIALARIQAMAERDKLEAQLRQATKLEAVGQLAGGVAHDFNNILAVVIGYGQMAIEQMTSDAPLRKKLESIVRAGERGVALTRQLLIFSRKQVAVRKVLSLNQVVTDFDKMLRRLIGEDIKVTLALAPDAGRIRADPGQIEQVIMNLCVNARDAMPKGGKLLIETSNVTLDEAHAGKNLGAGLGPHVMLAVSDTGSGMSSEVRSHLFEPFFTTKSQGKGTGLGLAVVYGIVKQYGGSIGVYSEEGHGTTFKVYFPRVDATADPSAPNRADSVVKANGETVLMVDDQDDVRNMVQEMLQVIGYQVLVCASPQDALRLVETHTGPLHLLLTDVVMPEMSGRELAERVKAKQPQVKVLFMSGYTHNVMLNYGVDGETPAFIEKPFNLGALAKKMKEMLHSATEATA